MTPTEIITKDATKRGVNPTQAINSIASMLKRKNATLLQHSNTVLLLRVIDNNAADLHLFTEDSPLTLLKALKVFVVNIKQTKKLDRVYGNADNQGILKLLEKAGVDILLSDLPQYNWMAKV